MDIRSDENIISKFEKNYLLSFALKEFRLYLNTTDITKDFYH